jgi:hypothetical protein
MNTAAIRICGTLVGLVTIAALPARGTAQLRPAQSPGRGASTAHTQKASAKAGQLVLMSEARRDLGPILQGQTAAHIFRIRNAGSGPLTVRLSEKSCGCTSVRINEQELQLDSSSSPGLPLQPVSAADSLPLDLNAPFPPGSQTPPVSRPISRDGTLPLFENSEPAATIKDAAAGSDASIVEAGESAHIEISVDTTQTQGPFHQHVTLSTNDPKNTSLELHLEGTVLPKIESSVPWLDLREIRSDQSVRQELRVTSRFLPDLRISEVSSSDPSFRIRTEKLNKTELQATAALSGYAIHVEVPAGRPIGQLNAQLSITTDQSDGDVLVVPVFGRVTGDLQFMTGDAVSVGIVSKGQSTTIGSYAKIRTTAPFTARIARIEPPYLKVEMHKPNNPGQGHQFLIFEVTIPDGAPEGEINGVIELETSLANARKAVLPVYGQIVDPNAPAPAPENTLELATQP